MTRGAGLLLALAACHHGAAPAPTIGNAGGTTTATAGAAGAGLRDGALWTCRVDDYDEQPCKLTRQDGGWHLAKLLGSQRFRGAVTFDGDAAHLIGQFFCPWGDCTTDLDVTFSRAGATDAYAGQMPNGPNVSGAALMFRYDAANEEAYAGAGYGGLTGDEQ